MKKTLPDILVVELCDARRSAAFMTEEQIEQSVRENSLATMVKSVNFNLDMWRDLQYCHLYHDILLSADGYG